MTAKSNKSRTDRTLRLSTIAIRRDKAASAINGDFIMSSLLNDPVMVTVKGSNISGPPGVILFKIGTAPNINLLRSSFKSDNVMDPTEFATDSIIPVLVTFTTSC
mmetsp:Transcript_28868/g.60362  ORF Transcript_28868/g.60362 Transcript_28868/m.60362 type:complete len:105 (+) Transcript_28868:172-486(+)